MAQVLKIGSLDLSAYVRVAHEDGLDPANPQRSEPQFAGSTAFGEGQRYVGDSVSNRQMSIPLILKAATADALYALVREINAALIRGAQVEYRSGGASASTFLDLEAGRLEEEFQFWLDQGGRARAMLHLWTRPHGHTGTTRLVASVPMGSAAAFQVPIAGVIGDRPALANLEVKVGSAVASNGRVVAWGIHPHPSFQSMHIPTPALAQSGATTRGASGAIASQFLAIPVSPTTASGVAYTAFLSPPDAHVGRHRIIGVGRSGLTGPISITAEDRFGAVIGTALATQTDVNKWQVLDLGEVQVPSRMVGQDPVPTQFVNLIAGGTSGLGVNASPAFHLDHLQFIPLDFSAGILVIPGVGQNSLLYEDSFDRLTRYAPLLSNAPAADSGVYWKMIGGVGLGAISPKTDPEWRVERALAPIATIGAGDPGQTIYLSGPNASGLAVLASGRLNSDVLGQLTIGLSAPSGVATALSPGAAAVFYPKAQSNASAVREGVGARLQLGTAQTLQIVSASSNGATAVLASAGIASTLASGLFLGQAHTLTMRILGPQVDVWLATGALAASPILSASHANALQAGWPAVGLQSGSNVASGTIYADSLRVLALAKGASGVSARESFRFESYPERRVIQGNASVFRANRNAEHRGSLPQIAPMGTPAATGPAQLAIFQGEIDNTIGNDGCDVIVGVRERFSYLR